MNSKTSSRRFERFSQFILLYTVFVIVWGAWVRISKSGDGCGEHWPLCHGEVIPSAAATATWIEFFHRLTSGLYGLFVLAAVVGAWRVFGRGHWVRRAALWTLFFTVTEALLGARLVLAGLVGGNASVDRAATMALHLINSLLLTGSVTLTGFWSRWTFPTRRNVEIRHAVLVVSMVLGFFFIGASGAIAALSKTLFPAESLWEGLSADWNQDSHFLVRLRIWHPVASTLIGLALAVIVTRVLAVSEVFPDERALRRFLALLIGALAFGYATLFLLSPVWMKLVHLALAHGLWIAFVILIASAFTREGSMGDTAL